jgi:hypothetical protein
VTYEWPLHTGDREPVNQYTSSILMGPSSLHTTLEGPTEYVNARWMEKSTWILTWQQTDHVSWSLGLFSKTYLLEVALAQNRETMALRNLTTVDLFYFIMCEDQH